MSLEGIALFAIFIATAFLSLQTPTKEPIIPYAAYIMLALQLAFSCAVLGYIRLRLSKKYQPVFTIFLLFGLLFILSLSSVHWSSYPELTFQRSMLVFIPLLLIILLAWSDSNPGSTFIAISNGLIIFVSALSAIGLFLYIFGVQTWIDGQRVQVFSIGPITLAQGLSGIPPFLRISSLTGNPNTLASWLAISLILTLYLIQIRQLGRLVGFVIFCLQLLSLFLTFSRAGIIATFVAFACYTFLLKPKKGARLKQTLSIALIIGIMVAVFFARSDTSSALDLNLRDQIWNHLVNSFLEKPITGVGFGVSGEAILLPHGIEFAGHNAHLEILAEIGLIGYLVFLAIWLIPLETIRRRLSKSFVPEEKATFAVIAAILISMLIYQFVEGLVLRYGFHTLYWGYLLVAGSHPELANKKTMNKAKIY